MRLSTIYRGSRSPWKSSTASGVFSRLVLRSCCGWSGPALFGPDYRLNFAPRQMQFTPQILQSIPNLLLFWIFLYINLTYVSEAAC
jgi:hypothetical protein